MDDKQPLTEYNPQWVAKYGHPFKGWDAPRPTSKCLHCKGTGMADEANECGFCYADIVTLIRKDAKAQTLGQALGQAVELLHVADELERRDAKIERLLEAGTALWAFLIVNSNEAITSHPQFNKVIRDWNRVSYEVRHD